MNVIWGVEKISDRAKPVIACPSSNIFTFARLEYRIRFAVQALIRLNGRQWHHGNNGADSRSILQIY